MSLLRKSIKTAGIGLQSSIVYKNNFILGFLSSSVFLVVQLVFWPVFFSAGADMNYAEIETTEIAGYYLNEMMTYSILIYFIDRGTSMMNIGGEIKNDIMCGRLNIHLIRPVKYLWMKWILSVSGQIVNFVLSIFVLPELPFF